MLYRANIREKNDLLGKKRLLLLYTIYWNLIWDKVKKKQVIKVWKKKINHGQINRDNKEY